MLGSSPGSGSIAPVIAAIIAALVLAATGPLRSGELYYTNFSEFAVGDDEWAGVPAVLPPCSQLFCGPNPGNWCADNAGLGVHGMLLPNIDDLGNIGFLGWDTPCREDVIILKSFNHDPVAEGTARIQIDTQMGITTSLNQYADSFFLSIFNINGDFLGGLRFVNTKDSNYGIWRLDGVDEFQTSTTFVRDDFFLIFIDIDVENNRWKAFYFGNTIFAGKTFTNTGSDLDLGYVGFEWQIHDPCIANHGANRLEVTDFSVFAIPVGEPNPTINSVVLDENGNPVISFNGEPGWDYQIEYAEGLSGTWLHDLPGSFFTGIPTKQPVSYTDTTTRQPAGRYYRIERTPTP